ncbi:DAO-domain-containing protein [Irpex rosettiformis]|uniref:DAO-domain-containing protein n=1 Tax=Irpex rosettiformis TaxID=378272 RepID=A0ACB8UB34_9APHY|nr:DAO-domain-containing protein [Irpex rosettiformis]
MTPRNSQVTRWTLTAIIIMSTLPIPLHTYAAHQQVLHLPPPLITPTALPVPNATTPYWTRYLSKDHTPSLDHGSKGPLTKDADICIIGSGITGVSAAYHLYKAVVQDGRPLNVVILEAREFCSGATGRNGGHLTPHAFAHFTTLSKRFGKEDAIRSLELERYTSTEIRKILAESGKTDDVDMVSDGRVILLFSKEEEELTRVEFDAAKEAGIDVSEVEWFSREETQERYGASYPSVKIPGNNVWPLKLVSHLYNLASSSSSSFNLTLHTHTPVTSISTTTTPNPAHRKVTLQTPRGEITCSAVLHATNGYASHLLPFFHGEIVPTRGQVISVRANTPSPFGKGREGFVGNDGFEYWFPRPKSVKRDDYAEGEEERELVILGGGREAAKNGKFEFYTVDDSVVNPEVGKVVRGFLPAVFPGRFDNGTEPEMEWTGIMGYTRSGEPFVGPVIDSTGRRYPGQYISAGYTGHGMPRAFACAEMIAGMILADLNGEGWHRPEWFPTHYLTDNRTIGQYV